MDPILEALLALLLMVLGAAFGVLLRRKLPDDHLDSHAKDIVRLGAALVATITALVLTAALWNLHQSLREPAAQASFRHARA